MSWVFEKRDENWQVWLYMYEGVDVYAVTVCARSYVAVKRSEQGELGEQDPVRQVLMIAYTNGVTESLEICNVAVCSIRNEGDDVKKSVIPMCIPITYGTGMDYIIRSCTEHTPYMYRTPSGAPRPYPMYSCHHRADGVLNMMIVHADRQEWTESIERANGEVIKRHHRADGPAIIRADGSQEWIIHGGHHRADGPAIIRPDGTQEWWLRRERHRADGPAIIRADGTREWWLDDERSAHAGPMIIRADGTQEWLYIDMAHRTDGPAIIRPDGTQEWRQFGQLHRVRMQRVNRADDADDQIVDVPAGPAIIRPDGTQEWYQRDLLHREDGPAVLRVIWSEERYQSDADRDDADAPMILRAIISQEWWMFGKRIRPPRVRG